MDIYKFARKIGKVLVISYIPGRGRGGGNDDYWYHCHFEDSKGCAAEGIFSRRGVDWANGIGQTPEEAIADYVRQIRGQKLGFDLLSEVIDVPKSLRV